ncbi:UDP-glucuronic acid dehydrogenase [Gammaproteobacteria bacterium]|nr:UDP-glucuronic acid dehydrogenase [Gammaproteobacteria bacterium]
MKISIICSSKEHPVNNWIERWITENESSHSIELFRKSSELSGGDILFIISCSEKILKEPRELFKKCLVLHASDLPDGKGWSPHVWQILEDKDQITLSLIEAKDEFDSGDIWKKSLLYIPKHFDFFEISELLFMAEMKMLDFAIDNFKTIKTQKQQKMDSPRIYKKREPKDSELNPEKSIREQFNLLRVSDPQNYPAFFNLYGHKYKILIEKDEK